MPIGNAFAILKSVKIPVPMVETFIDINQPSAMVFDSNDNLFVTCSGGSWINKITPDGVMTTFIRIIADGSLTETINPYYLAIDSDDNIYVPDPVTQIAAGLEKYHYKIHKISPSGNISVHIDNIGSTQTIAIDSNNNLFVSVYADVVKYYQNIFKYDSSLAVTQNFGNLRNRYVSSIAINAKQDIFFSDVIAKQIYKIPKNGTESQLYKGGLIQPTRICFDEYDNLYINDNNLIIKKISSGNISTLAGSAPAGDKIGVGTLAKFNTIAGIAYRKGVLYIADFGNNKIKKLIL